jgi:Domain of unknown function (DUF1929)/Fibronectin type III domain
VRTRRSSGAAILLFAVLLAEACGGSNEGRSVSSVQDATAIAFVQRNYATPQSPVTTVSVPFTAAQSAGNLNVVVVGWNDTTAQVISVTDTKANAYQRAVGPTLSSGAVSQSIYYAKNIAAASAGANAVKVSFTAAANYADIRVLEYSGLDTVNPVDVTAFGSGSTATSSTQAAVTTNASDLLVAANTVNTVTKGPGTGWTSRVITVPDSDIAEDRVVSVAGSYSATAPLSGAGPWVMQMVAFKTAPSAPPAPPTAPTNLAAAASSTAQIDLSWTNTSTTQTGVKIERSPDNVTFTQIALAGATAASYSDAGLSASTTYFYRVRATNAAGDSPYSNVASATTLSPPPPPTAPTNLAAAVASSTQINLSWTNTSSNQTGVKIERSTDNATFVQITVVGATAVSYSDTGLSGSTTYFYRVRATNVSGDSPYSNTASGTTPAPPPPPATPPTFVQMNYATPQSPVTTVSVPFKATQSAANLNAVVVGWNDTTAQVASVTDSKGNAYQRAVGPTLFPGAISQSIYYASNIAAAAAGANSVKVSFTAAANYADVRVLEYSGLDTVNPLDVTASGNGSTATSSTSAVSTTNASDLLVAANTVNTITNSAGTGWTNRVITVPNGDIAEDRVVSVTGSYAASAPLSGAGPWVMQLVAFKAAPSGPPPSPPSAPTSLTAIAVSSAQINLSWTNTSTTQSGVKIERSNDNVTFAQIALAAGTAVSYSDTGLRGSTTYFYRVRATNVSGDSPYSNTASTTTPAPPPTGQWSAVSAWPIVAVHMTLLPNGKVLTWDNHSDNDGTQVFDPVANSFSAAPFNPQNLFCSGHAMLSDGRVLVAGGHVNGHVGITATTIFDSVNQGWTSVAAMPVARWYPTVTALPDGRMLATAGEINCDGCNALIPGVYDPATNSWTQLTNASQEIPYYPHMFVLPDGRVLAASAHRGAIASIALNVAAQSWTAVDPAVVDGGSAAMYVPGKIIKSGLAREPDLPAAPSVATTYVIDMNQPAPTWRQTTSMAFPRTEHNLTLLPDGSVLVTGGSRNSDVGNTSAAVLEAELWSPTTETWTTMAAMQTPRMYHSTALLLPDGRVLVAGGGRDFPEVDQLSAEIYSPGYLFKGPRPAITSAPSAIQYGTVFFVGTPDGARIATASLLRLGSVTHAFNQNQRFVPVSFQPGAGGLNLQAPANANLAPPGHYMLFIVDTNGIPSVAAMVRLS